MTAVRGRAAAFRWLGRPSARVAGGLACAALLLGCAAGDDSAGADPDEAPSTTETVEIGTTTDPPTTTSPTTTTTVVATTTTIETTTTLAEPTLDDLEAEIAAAYQERFDGYWACLRSPSTCDTSWLAPGSPSEQAMLTTIEALVDRNRFVGDDDVGYFVIESVEVSDSRTQASVLSCWWSTAVLYTTPADPSRPAGQDNPPTIVNNTPSSGRQVDEFVLVDGRWLLSSGRLVGDDYEEDQCGGAG